MGTSYEPKPGTDWEEGPSPLEGVRRWRTLVEPGLHLTVTFAEDCAVIARVSYGTSMQLNEPPMPDDLGRIERDFGVRGWSIQGVHPVVPPSVGVCLMARAVWPS